MVSDKRRLHFAPAGIASPGLRKSSRTPKVAFAPSIARSRTTTGRKAFDTRIGAFVLGMNETGQAGSRPRSSCS
jgi:hypothetical protein